MSDKPSAISDQTHQKPSDTVISVVTVVLNDPEGLSNTIKSVALQTYGSLQLLVVDGGSDDATMCVISELAKYVDICISEPDNGIYDAMNKGLRVATGEWIIFMNAGDVFADKTVIDNIFSKPIPSHIGILFGDTLVEHIAGQQEYIEARIDAINHRMPCCHQSIFVRAELHKSKEFNLKYLYAADFAFLIESYRAGVPFSYVDRTISRVRYGGFSNKNQEAVLWEYYLISNPRSFSAKCYFFGKIFGAFMRRLFKLIAPGCIISAVRSKRLQRSGM